MACEYSFSPASFVENAVLSLLNNPGTLVKKYLTTYVGVSLPGLSCVPLVYMSLYVSTTLFWLLELCHKYWNQEAWDHLLYSFWRLFWLYRVSWDSIRILEWNFLILETNFVVVALNLKIAWSSIDILIILYLPVHERRMSVYLFIL